VDELWDHPDGVLARCVERIVDHAAERAESLTELPAGVRSSSARAVADRAVDHPRLIDGMFRSSRSGSDDG
jgi:hypothetical protein